MTKKHIIIIFSTLICGYSCNSNDESSRSEPEKPVVVQKSNISCDSLKINDFNRFLNFRYGDSEALLTGRLGQMSSGNFSNDSTVFIYNYMQVPRVPIQIWVNAVTNKVTTIFMEVLSLQDNFKNDLDAAVQAYNIKPCDEFWFGRSADEIKKQLGEPANDVVTKEFVNEITYFSNDGQILVVFKVYPQQNDVCSSVGVTWFYD